MLAQSILIYRQITAVVASIGPFLAVGDPLVPCGGGGMHRSRSEQVDFLHFKRSHPRQVLHHLFKRMSPDDLTSRRGTNAIYGVHMAPFLTALAMVGDVRRRSAWGERRKPRTYANNPPKMYHNLGYRSGMY